MTYGQWILHIITIFKKRFGGRAESLFNGNLEVSEVGCSTVLTSSLETRRLEIVRLVVLVRDVCDDFIRLCFQSSEKSRTRKLKLSRPFLRSSQVSYAENSSHQFFCMTSIPSLVSLFQLLLKCGVHCMEANKKTRCVSKHC